MVPTFLIPEAMKAQQWEIAKGHLRALVALQGSYQSSDTTYIKFAELGDKVEEFIKDVEDNGLQE